MTVCCSDECAATKWEPTCADEWLELLGDIGLDYDGCGTVESLKVLVDELIGMSRKARECLCEGKIFPVNREDFAIITLDEIVKGLDEADLFLRDRVNAKPALLNEYDIAILLDIAKVCDEAANIINSQKAEMDRLSAEVTEKDALLYHQGRIIRMLELAGEEKLAEIDRLKKDTYTTDEVNAIRAYERWQERKRIVEALRGKGKVYVVGPPNEPKRVLGFEETEFEALLPGFDGVDLHESECLEI